MTITRIQALSDFASHLDSKYPDYSNMVNYVTGVSMLLQAIEAHRLAKDMDAEDQSNFLKLKLNAIAFLIRTYNSDPHPAIKHLQKQIYDLVNVEDILNHDQLVKLETAFKQELVSFASQLRIVASANELEVKPQDTTGEVSLAPLLPPTIRMAQAQKALHDLATSIETVCNKKPTEKSDKNNVMGDLSAGLKTLQAEFRRFQKLVGDDFISKNEQYRPYRNDMVNIQCPCWYRPAMAFGVGSVAAGAALLLLAILELTLVPAVNTNVFIASGALLAVGLMAYALHKKVMSEYKPGVVGVEPGGLQKEIMSFNHEVATQETLCALSYKALFDRQVTIATNEKIKDQTMRPHYSSC